MLVTHGGWDDKDVDEAFDNINLAGVSMPSVLTSLVGKKEEPAPAPAEPAPVTAPTQPAQPAQPTPSFSTVNGAVHLASPSPVAPFQDEPTPNPSSAFMGGRSTQPVASSPTAQQTGGFVPAASFQQRPGPRTMEPTQNIELNTQAAPKPATPVMPPQSIVPAQPATAPISPVQPRPSDAPSEAIMAAIPGMKAPTPPQESKPNLLSEIRTKFSAGDPVRPQTPQIPAPAPVPVVKQQTVPGMMPSVTSQQVREAPITPFVQPKVMQPRPSVPVTPITSAPAPATAPRMNPIQQLVPGQGIQPMQNPTNLGMQYAPATTVLKQKPRGRKLFGAVMFIMGLIIGAVVMHAYLSGYFVSMGLIAI